MRARYIETIQSTDDFDDRDLTREDWVIAYSTLIAVGSWSYVFHQIAVFWMAGGF